MDLKKISAALFGALTLLGLTSCSGSSTAESSAPESSEETVSTATDNVTITAFNVGKADALVVQTANSVTVIDTGNKGDGKDIEKFLTAQGIDSIDTLIITHFDKDHVGGAARLVNRMNIGTIYVPDYVSTAEDYLSFIEKTQEKEQEVTVVPKREVLEWTADDASFTLYACNEDDYGKDEENDFSLCLYMKHGNNTFLFAGDAENARLSELIELGLGTVDFLKFPYHGNYMSTTEAFLDAFQPKVTVVCCSEKEYADPSTVETLEKRGIETYYTNDSTVTIVSDGTSLTCSQAAAE